MPSLEVLISAEQIQTRIEAMAAEIDRDYAGATVYLVCVLKGACIFLADLARAMKTPARLEFIGISSYGTGTTSSGEVRVTKDLDVTVEGQHVILVEDIVDTGVTVTYLLKLMERRKPATLRVATLIDKPSHRVRPVQVNYTGFQIPDKFVVGYGLDYAGNYRNLTDVCVLGE